MESISRRIRAFRKLRGITQHELADGVNISIDIIGAIERGNRVPDMELLKKISTFLNVELSELMKKN